jgi:hypothetical protein
LEAISNVEAIQKKVRPHVKVIFESFINDTYDNNWIVSDIKEWILANYLSQKDIEEILALKPSFLRIASDKKEVLFKKLLYVAFVFEAIKYLDDKGDFLLKSLISLMYGITDQIDVRSDAGDAEKLKNTQEIIEERIVPLLVDLSNEETEKAQEILKLGST